MITKAKLSLLLLSLITATLVGCADNPAQMNVNDNVPLNVQNNPNPSH
jgi:hypothetical protein